MPQNVLTALNMILQSREQRERAEVSAALSGMELALREQEMGSMALDRSERRRLQEMQIGITEDELKLKQVKQFQEQLTKIQGNELNNLHQGAAVMFDTMFSTLFRNNTAGGVNFKEGNYDGIVNDLTGKHYKFSKLDAQKIAGHIMSYGVGKDKPNALAMAELARFMKGKYQTDKKFVNSMVRGGMVADPTQNPESAKAWLANMEGMIRTEANIFSLRKEWQDFSDADPDNDLTMRPLTGIYDFIKKTGKTGGTGGGGGFNIAANLMQLDAEVKAIAEFKKERDVISSNTAYTTAERDKALNDLKFVAFGDDKEPVKTSYQGILQDYDVAPGYFEGGAEEKGLLDKNIYMQTDEYALKEPAIAVDAIADFRDKLNVEKKDALSAITKANRTLELSKSIDYDKLSQENKTEVRRAEVEVFRESERLTAINDAMNKFYLQADLETEKFLDDAGWTWGDPTGSKSFRQASSFPYELLTTSERKSREEQIRMSKGFEEIQKRGSGGRMY